MVDVRILFKASFYSATLGFGKIYITITQKVITKMKGDENGRGFSLERMDG